MDQAGFMCANRGKYFVSLLLSNNVHKQGRQDKRDNQDREEATRDGKRRKWEGSPSNFNSARSAYERESSLLQDTV